MSQDKSDVRLISVLRSSGGAVGDTELRIVSWNDKAPVLEKRLRVLDKTTGEPRVGRCVGMSLEEVGYVVGNWPDVQRAMLEADAKNARAI